MSDVPAIDIEVEKAKAEEYIKRISKPNQPIEDLVKAYDDWADRYESDLELTGYGSSKQCAIAFLTLDVAKDARILEIFCRTGMIGSKLKEAGYTNVEALEGSTKMIEKARLKECYKEIHNILIRDDFGVEKGVYDVIILNDVFHPGHLRVELLPKVVELLKPEGIFVTECWHKDSKIGDEAATEYYAALDAAQDALVSDGVIEQKGPIIKTEVTVYKEFKYQMKVYSKV